MPQFYLKKNYPLILQKKYISYTHMTNSIYKNEVDAIFSEALIMWNELIKSTEFSNVIKLKNFNYKSNIYAGVQKKQ